ncbi:transcription antitermination factor NusB [Desulfoluna butyratoxydans]|uniref:Transcription antitermination protein NusB n=1 Tax=Desulfoluna butyratoxydans TaxID=231438 RepID=A0A4U8YQC6_9BACT|nr:transcription antitermination factor NusB [Desulfoluna butyratoxydans]VFQ43942.1 nusb antitermination factor [Desulfoluna butyratoxydans]
MGVRRGARELALQALFFADIKPQARHDAVQLFRDNYITDEAYLPFFDTLTEGVLDNLEEIDAAIANRSKNWKVYRMSSVDRNALRVGVFEIMFLEDVPDKVAINEAIEIGKHFGTAESGAFINGILDAVSADKS